MFAVVVLGIGFIMVAAIFPVAIKQTQSSAEESFSAAIAQNGVSYLEQLGSKSVRCYTAGGTGLFIDVPALFATDLLVSAIDPDNVVDPRFRPNRALKAEEHDFYPRISVPGSYAARGKVLALGDLRVFNSTEADSYYPLRSTQLAEGYGSAIVPSDTRYAYIPLYRRDRAYSCRVSDPAPQAIFEAPFSVEDSAVAQVIVFGVQIRNRTQFETRDLPLVPNQTSAVPIKLANLQPRPVGVRVVPETFFPGGISATTYVAQFFSARTLSGNYPRGGFPSGANVDRILDAAPAAVGEGCYFVISDDRIVNDPSDSDNDREMSASVAGLMNGRIFRIGQQRTDLGENIWDLYPGFEFNPDPGADGISYDTGLPATAVPASRLHDDIIAIGISTSAASGGTVTVANGQTYRSNVKVDGTPDVTPGNILNSFGQGAVAYIMGRGLSEDYVNNTTANPPAPTFDGTAMDVSIYTTVIKVK